MAHGKDVRNRCKAIVLGVGYGMGAESMAERAGLQIAEARELLRRHRETYRVFWQWAENNVNVALAGGVLRTVYGWPIRSGPRTKLNDRSLLNFPMQANGAEMLRMAACMATEAGLRVCAPIHDALLLEAPLDRLDEDVFLLKGFMVIGGQLHELTARGEETAAPAGTAGTASSASCDSLSMVASPGTKT